MTLVALLVLLIVIIFVYSLYQNRNYTEKLKKEDKIGNTLDQNTYGNAAPEIKALGTIISNILRADNEINSKELKIVKKFAYEMYSDDDAATLTYISPIPETYNRMNLRKACNQINYFFPEYIDRYAICEQLFTIVATDGVITGNEWSVLLQIIPNLNINVGDIAYFKNRYVHLVKGKKNNQQYSQYNYNQSKQSTSKAVAIKEEDLAQYYAVLGLDKTATKEMVQKTYRQLAKKYHPDTTINPALQNILTEKFKEISNAYNHLKVC